MNRRRLIFPLLALAVAAFVWWKDRDRARPMPAASRSTGPADTTIEAAAPRGVSASRLAALAREISPDAISPIAQELNAPNTTIQRDLQLLHEVFGAWQTNFPNVGNPVGDNADIALALAGENRLRFAFIAPNHRAINAAGELCDRWGTPFRFHALSGTQMEIRSAGPDRVFATKDDVEFAPWPKSF